MLPPALFANSEFFTVMLLLLSYVPTAPEDCRVVGDGHMVERDGPVGPEASPFRPSEVAAEGDVDEARRSTVVPQPATARGLVVRERHIRQLDRRAFPDVEPAAVRIASVVVADFDVVRNQRGVLVGVDPGAVDTVQESGSVVPHDRVLQRQHTVVVDAAALARAVAGVVLDHHVGQRDVGRSADADAGTEVALASLDRQAAQVDRCRCAGRTPGRRCCR